MKLAPMSYHYLRYPITRFLDKVERSPFDSIDLYCSAPQLNIFDYSKQMEEYLPKIMDAVLQAIGHTVVADSDHFIRI